MKNRIRVFIEQELLDGLEENSIGDSDDILNNGTVDSMGVIRLVSFIEQETGVSIPPEDLVIENFESINAIETYLAKRP